MGCDGETNSSREINQGGSFPASLSFLLRRRRKRRRGGLRMRRRLRPLGRVRPPSHCDQDGRRAVDIGLSDKSARFVTAATATTHKKNATDCEDCYVCVRACGIPYPRSATAAATTTPFGNSLVVCGDGSRRGRPLKNGPAIRRTDESRVELEPCFRPKLQNTPLEKISQQLGRSRRTNHRRSLSSDHRPKHENGACS